MPQPVFDLYRTTVMLEAIKLIPIKQTFLRDNFFPVVKEFITEDALIDIKRKQRIMAPVVSRRRRGQAVQRYSYNTRRVEPPFISPGRTLTLEDLEKRLPGEDVFDPMSVEERQMAIFLDDTDELMEMLDRREEWMCSKVLLTGAITMQSDDPTDAFEYTIDYSFTQNITLSGASLWSAYTTSNPFADFRSGIDTVSANSVVIPDTVVMNSITWGWFIASQQVQRTLFANKIDIGNIGTAGSAGFPGAMHVARLTDPPVDIYTYNEWYADLSSGSIVNTKIIPDGKVLLLQSKAGGNSNRLYCSAVKQMDPETTQYKTYGSRRVPRVWADQEDQVRKYTLTSKILPAPIDVNNWAVMTVL